MTLAQISRGVARVARFALAESTHQTCTFNLPASAAPFAALAPARRPTNQSLDSRSRNQPHRLYSSSTTPNPCSTCSKPLPTPLCPTCGSVQPLSPLSHFALLNSNQLEFDDSPGTQLSSLKKKFLELQAAIHPDSFAAKGGQQKERAEAWSAAVNRGYQVLRDPLSRALYILEENGTPLDERDSDVAPELLMEVLETMEQLQETTDPDEVAAVRASNEEKYQHVVGQMKEAFAARDWDAFRKGTVELRYLTNIRAACDGWVGGGRRAEMLH